MTTPLRLGIAGLGTVGTGVVKIIRQKAQLLETRAGRPVTISAVSARTRDKDRGVTLSNYAWEDDPVALATRDDVDLFVELMGGSDGPAKAATEAALKAGKHVVTANKAMLAHHGQSLAELAEANDAVPEAAMLTAAAPCAADGFVIANENAYSIPAARVWAVWTASVSVPELKAPLPCVEPSEKKSAALFDTLASARLALSGAPVSPVMVTSDPSVAARLASIRSVTSVFW